MREIIVAAIRGSADITDLGVASEAVFAGDIDTPTQRPFIQLRWGSTTPGMGTPGRGMDRRGLVIWVHDQPNDYTRIDQIIRAMKRMFYDLVATPDGAGDWLSQMDYVGDSDDLSDDGHGTICRTSTWTIVGTGL